MKKKFPDLKTDAEAETFVESAHLSEYDFSDMIPMRFELRRKDKSVSLRLPERLLDEVRSHAERANMPYQRFIRMAIERALQSPRGRGHGSARQAGKAQGKMRETTREG